MTQEILVLGGGATGLEVAGELAADGQSVALVDEAATVERARKTGVVAHESALDTSKLAVEQTAATVVVATPSDARNLLLGATAPHAFGADRVVALVNDPDRREAFEDAGIETVCVSAAVARATTETVAVETSTPPTRPEQTPPNQLNPTPPNRAAGTDERVRLRG
ncbi:NAD-binding protein [Halorarius litoreus]|uniref:NAD-binding protein n=1 Tax=Halorarius litoreus TaxID=2962676 RepID=UPI0020CDD677|nr:NAD-binding protein [Halorarius litoreus]